jgi:putative ABC transport system substrate-binding protein
MRRRQFITLAAGAAALGPSAAAAQSVKVPTIGVLVVAEPGSERFWRRFRAALREFGWYEGRNVRFEFRSDQGQPARLAALAAELVGREVDVIVTWFTPPAIAAKRATDRIPIVMALAGDPVATGLVETLSRPGGNVTGMSGDAAELAGKNLEFIRQMLPSVRRVTALANAPNPFSKPFLEQVRRAGVATGTAVDPVMLYKIDDLDAVFGAMAMNRPDAVIVQPTLGLARVARLALRDRLPAVSPFRPFVEDGGLMSYWFVESDLYRHAAMIVDKVLKGAKPADLPVEQPTNFELVINMKTAGALGLTVPSILLARASEIIE